MMLLFLKLLLCHILGDFVLQTKRLVQQRSQDLRYLLLHIAIHAALLALVFCTSLDLYGQALIFVVCSHLAIDSMKIWWERKYPFHPTRLFVLDQLLHVGVLVAVVVYIYGIPEGLIAQLLSEKSLLYLTAFLLAAWVCPIFLRIFFTKWTKQQEFVAKQQQSLVDAGMLIGIMERLIIILFIQVSFLSGIGFLLAAKSIFRFGDLTNAKDTKYTEYILVGTLASFLLAIVIGYGLRMALEQLI